LKQLLKRIPLFSGLSEDELDSIARLTVVTRIPKKHIVVHEGEPGDAMYVILKGLVKIVYYTPEGREVVLSLLGGGEFFGEMALLDKEPRSATVMTLEDSEFAYIRRSDFENLLTKNPNLALEMLSEVTRRLRRTSNILERISTMDVPHRLYDFLCDYCRTMGKEDGHGQYILKLPTHQLIADQLSTSRETISRAISALKKKGIISPVHGRRLVRIDMRALESLLETFR
jgi:CRP/FNR family transcriptional regulator/CRP/FNR family cyclic AMP-dependent transcriptional regulator